MSCIMILNAYVERTDVVSRSGTSGVYLCRKSKDMCFSNIDIKKNKGRCLELLRSTGREEMEDMIIELEKMGLFNLREETSNYTASYEDFPMGHGEKSVILALAGGLEMYDSEMIAIRWHMGAWRLNQDDNEEKQCYKAATDRFPLVTILQTADTLAARIIE